MHDNNTKWEWEIGPKPVLSLAALKKLLKYRHFHSALVRRDFLLNYQQTVLGPIWIFFQPVLTLIVYILVFGKLIGIPTGKNIPPVLFYFSGIILWNFFNDVFWGVGNTFREHIHLYSKVYFPRIVVPASVLSTNFLRFVVQLLLLVLLLVYFIVFKDFDFNSGASILALPLVFIGIGMISMGSGLIAAILTARYRDIMNLLTIVLRLLMFVTPVLYPLALVKEEFKWVVLINPLTPLFELFRYSLLGEGTIHPSSLIYSFSFGLIILITALYLFNTRSSKLIDIA